ncbi:MAG: hypothetical protein JNL58_09660 [Planctomyces sp.]|nr:hypothetical protein [Planctomyces sp.]
MRRFAGLMLAVQMISGLTAFNVVTPVVAELRAGAVAVDVTPIQLPVLVNGGMTSRSLDSIGTRLYARALVLDDGMERVAIVVVDSCMMSKSLLDDAKHLAAGRTSIRPDRMLISATHTHTAPASMGCLGTDVDTTYAPYLRDKLAEAIAAAESRLEPARAGWATADAGDFTALRQWVIRPDRMIEDPFGNQTVRANMHAGANHENVTGEAGPEDPELSVFCLKAADGRPIAMLANFSMHYFSGVDGLNADYFGMFCKGLEDRFGRQASDGKSSFVAIMSHGCSGDIWRRDYTKTEWPNPAIQDYTEGLLSIAEHAVRNAQYEDESTLAMLETRLPLKYRVPDKQLLEWSQRIVESLEGRLPQSTEEVYAREQVFLHEMQSTEVVIQAIRIGGMAIATTPCETYALTGLKLKHQSPLNHTMVIELANGGDGYIPPAEHHPLGGYNTWAARSAGLEVQAEGKIAEAALGLLEQVSGSSRKEYKPVPGPAVETLTSLKPVAWYRMHEFGPPHATDSAANSHHGIYEPGVLFFLEGAQSSKFSPVGHKNRAPHFAGGRMRALLPSMQHEYSVSMWIWNGMPADGRPISGWMLSRGTDHGLQRQSIHLGVSGTAHEPGRLLVQTGAGSASTDFAVGKTTVPRWEWTHVAFVHEKSEVRVYLNGGSEPEVRLPMKHDIVLPRQWFFGGRSDNDSNWEGRLDEIAVFDRILTLEEIQQLSAK